MVLSPCVGCDRNGCGAYHDKCGKFQEYKDNVAADKKAKDDFLKQSVYQYHSYEDLYGKRKLSVRQRSERRN